jgi:hypothetical protein
MPYCFRTSKKFGLSFQGFWNRINRLEIIQEGAQGTVDIGEGLEFSGDIETAVADILPDALEIFLFDETVVVFLLGPGAGEGDTAGITPGQEGRVDKFRGVVAVDA